MTNPASPRRTLLANFSGLTGGPFRYSVVLLIGISLYQVRIGRIAGIGAFQPTTKHGLLERRKADLWERSTTSSGGGFFDRLDELSQY